MRLRTGKIGANVLDRSVRKRVKNFISFSSDSGLYTIRDSGSSSGFFHESQIENRNERIMTATDAVTLRTAHAGMMAVHALANDLAAAGTRPERLETVILLPPGSSEEELRQIVDEISETSAALGMRIVGGHTEVTSAVQRAVVICSGTGTAFDQTRAEAKTAEKSVCSEASGNKVQNLFYLKNGIESSIQKKQSKKELFSAKDIVLTKWIGLEGTFLLASECEAQLSARFPASMIRRSNDFRELISVIPESAAAIMSGAVYMVNLSEGGVFEALWKLSSETGTGLDIELKKIPVRQETIEFCNWFNINPYQMESAGSLLILADRGDDMVSALELEKIPAAVIGRTTTSNDKIIRNGEEIRYLDLPAPDSLIGILGI